MGISPQKPHKLALRSPTFQILLVDDTALNRMVTINQLRVLGFEAIDCAENGKIALDCLQHKAYDLVLMDCRMPVLDGYEATEIIRRNEREGQHQIIVAMTANVLAEERQRCVEAGMDDYIAKPIILETLKTLLDRCSECYFPDNAQVEGVLPTAKTGDIPIDFELLESILGQDPELHQIVLQELFNNLPNYLQRLDQAIAADDLTAVSEEAHRLKGSFMMSGVKNLPELCDELETAASDGYRDQVLSLVKTLHVSVEPVYLFIQDHYQS